MSIQIKQTNFELLATGEYHALIDDIEYSEGRYGQQLQWRFAIQGQHVGSKLTGWTSPTFSANSKLFAWTKAALGVPSIPKGQEFSSDEIVGKLVILVVVQTAGENGFYNKIEEVKPYST